ncbi:hypothetical protein [Nocardiopsis rhodophaea]|uniref:hypothetical protein n=1 Tax=Nocardiopsis rhodophaea TaxID=280238 RepID=UPI0031E28324
MSSDSNAYLMVIGDREALAWVLSTRQTAFPAGRRGQVAQLTAGDELFVYTTRGCFRNPSRDRGRVIASATVTGPVVQDDDPVRFGERSFPLRCPLAITHLAPFGTGLELGEHLNALELFPDPRWWSIRLRRPPVPIGEHDRRYIADRLRTLVRPIDESLDDYVRLGSPAQAQGPSA